LNAKKEETTIMTNAPDLLLALSAGFGIGVAFYGGLWLTVSRLGSTAHPVLLVAASFIARTACALAGIWFASAGDLTRLALCLGGFVMARWLIFWTTSSRSRT
jgi:F1F0 ATPase subunit 2